MLHLYVFNLWFHSKALKIFISEKVCNVADDIYRSIVPLDENEQFHMHVFGYVSASHHTVIAKVVFTNNENWLEFWPRGCGSFNSKREIDLYGICDPTTPLLLQEFKWNKVHVTIQRSANIEYGTIKPNNHCPYGEDVQCIIIDIQEKPSVLHFKGAYVAMNCISGKISCFLKN